MNNILSFEKGIPNNLECDKSSEIKLSNDHFKHGTTSLQWNFKRDSYIVLKELIGYKPFVEGALDQSRDSFCVWIYNEKPLGDHLTFQFGSDDRVECYFTFNLNFKGWRTAWVTYERDMEGIPTQTMNRLSIIAPKKIDEGVIFIGEITHLTSIDPRYPTRDYQVPFVNLEADNKANSHWLSLYLYSTLKSQLHNTLKMEEVEEGVFQVIEERILKYIAEKQVVKEEDIAEVVSQFNSYDIKRVDGRITGCPVNSTYYFDMYPRNIRKAMKKSLNIIDFKKTAQFLLDVAQKYLSVENITHKKLLRSIFIDLAEHLEDQGWSYGSSLGTTHHLGYVIRSYYNAMFLMRDVLKEENLLIKIQKTMSWFSGLGRIFTNINEKIEINMDTLNTTIQGMLFSILMIEDKKERYLYLLRFKKWLSVGLLPAPGIIGPFKIDGAVFHHDNHYPAYAEGGLLGLTPVIYFISGTPFRIEKKAHELIKKVLLMMRIYCNKYQWLKSLSARRVTGEWRLNVIPYRYMALAGTPDGKEKIDVEMAAAYLRLIKEDTDNNVENEFTELGIKPEEEPNGNWVINYASLALHRRSNWLVGMRGHSRYLWANETYVDANLYGRYISHGHLQILSQGNPVNNEDSGFHSEGWDWNRWPGTTAIHLPIDKLRSNVVNVDTFSGFEEMLLSDETFSGGLNLEGKNGMFAMKLHEHPKYEGTHRANKSVFFFDNRIICLGSNIENANKEYETETTLFQNHLKDIFEPIWVNDKIRADFDFTESNFTENPMFIIDNKENGFFIPKGYKVSVSKCKQYSKADTDERCTEGNFASAWINHGSSPKEQSYEYAILVKTDINQMKEFYNKMSNAESALYRVLQMDKSAHIVEDRETGIVGYALFEANSNINIGVIKEVDTPVMVMTREIGNELNLSICDPDLRLYTGIDESQYDENGNRIEVSVYSRKWRTCESQKSIVKLSLVGNWSLSAEGENYKIISANEQSTMIEFVCQHAQPIEILLRKIQK